MNEPRVSRSRLVIADYSNHHRAPRGKGTEMALSPSRGAPLLAALVSILLAGCEGAGTQPNLGTTPTAPDNTGVVAPDPKPTDPTGVLTKPLPPRQPELAKDRVLVKLASPGSTTGAAGLLPHENEVLTKLRQIRGFRHMRPQFRNAVPPRAGETIEGPHGRRMPKPDLTRWQRVEIHEGEDVDAVLAELRALPGIEVAEPDYLRRPTVLPGASTDPLYSQQWHLDAANVPAAWAHLESLHLPPGGARDVVVAVIDTGVDMTHPDLVGNLWTDGATGHHGYDVVADDFDPSDDHGHGTHVAGIIAAAGGNGAGGVGVAYNVQIMPIKAAQYSGVLSAGHIAEAITWAVNHGADIINMSFGGYGKSQIEEDALAVAFGSAVLVAAAGNDGLTNDPACNPMRWGVMYPGGYNWVLGVMASHQGGGLASFSNWDCISRDTREYEVLAPGAEIWSALPGGQYAAWSGTSMATPVVSGIAALVRTKFTDRQTFNSRFIMGQLAGTGTGAVDALASLTSTPQPDLAYERHWIFDTASIDPNNNGNGTVDAGETIDLAVVIRNHWGKADNVTVTMEPWAEGAAAPDPYVTMITPTVTYGSVGSFSSDDNGLIRDAAGVVVGVSSPLRFSLLPGTPNGHIIPFRVTITATNGLSPGDATVYSQQSRFEVSTTSARELPRIISTDTVLGPDHLWTIRHPVLVEEGATLTIQPGTRVEFAFKDTSVPYQLVEIPILHVNGTLVAEGTAELPVELTISELARCFHDANGVLFCPAVRIKNNGTSNIRYARILNPFVGFEPLIFSQNPGFDAPLTSIDHTILDYRDLLEWTCTDVWGIAAATFSNSIARRLGAGCQSYKGASFDLVQTSLFQSVLMDSSKDILEIEHLQTSAFLDTLDISLLSWATPIELSHNAFLNNYQLTDPAQWMRITAQREYQCNGDTRTIDASNNYWGTTSTSLIDLVIRDYYDNFSCPRVEYVPFLATPSEQTYPFVASVSLISDQGQPTSLVGAETATFEVRFNRDMDPTVQPQVSFGPAAPYTDHLVTGAWSDPRTWTGTFSFNGLTGDGNQFVRVAGARAASDPWLVTGDDQGRFTFEVVTSGSAAMNLQATGGEQRVDLSWTQDDFDLLAGFNLYRSMAPDGGFTRVNPSILPPHQRSFTDTSVAPGQTYYYHFVIVKTDMTESQPSNVASATPFDTIDPVIVHEPVTAWPPGMAISLGAQVTDNVAVRGVELHFRPLGATVDFTTRPMINTTGDNYTATIEGSLVAWPGVEYFLSATDGVNTATHGRAEYPHEVVVDDRPMVTAASPTSGPIVGGTAVVLSGTNFQAGASVTFGGAVASNVQVGSESQITCVTPPHVPLTVDVVVTNPNGRSGTLLRGFTYESGAATVSLPSLEAGQQSVVETPILAGVEGLLSADISITYDPAVILAVGARKGPLAVGFEFLANTSQPGTVHLSMATLGGGSTGTGALAYLDFEVIGAAGTSSPLSITAIALNGGAVPANTDNGTITVESVFDVSGRVAYWSGNAGVPGVELTLDGDRRYTAVSDSTGAFTVTGARPGDYQLAAAKTGDDDGITAYDASLVLQHAAHFTTLTGHAATAADVDKSGTINSLDAAYILQRAADLLALPFPGAGVTWHFEPATRAIASLSAHRTGQDFTAILLGDVSGNWSAAAPQALHGTQAAPSSRPAGALELRIAELRPEGDTLVATVAMRPEERAIRSLDLVLRYDPSRGTPVAVAPGSAASGWMVASNLETPGRIRLSLAGATPVAAEGTVVDITFTTAGGAGEVGLLAESGAVDEALPVDARYTFSFEHALLAARIASGEVAPNPGELGKYDVAPVVAGERAPDGIVDVEDLVVILREAQGRDL